MHIGAEGAEGAAFAYWGRGGRGGSVCILGQRGQRLHIGAEGAEGAAFAYWGSFFEHATQNEEVWYGGDKPGDRKASRVTR